MNQIQILEDVLADEYDLEGDDLKRCSKLAAGVPAMESEGWHKAASRQAESLQEEYGVDYDELESAFEDAREAARDADELFEGESTEETTESEDLSESGRETLDRLKREADELDMEVSEMTIAAKDEIEWLRDIWAQADEDGIKPENLAITRATDAEEVSELRDSLTDRVSDLHDIPPEETDGMSLVTLRRLAADETGTKPDPKSGDLSASGTDDDGIREMLRNSDTKYAEVVRESLYND